MKEKSKLIEEVTKERVPMLSLSVTNLEIIIEEGRVYKGSFLVESDNRIPLEGWVCSTNDKVGLEVEQISGLRQEVPYYFKGKLAAAGCEFEGDFVLITNGGEYNIPYRFIVVPKTAQSSIGPISNMEEFAKLYAQNRAEAAGLFFLPNFAEVFLQKSPEERALYHSLMKSRSRNLILEEFLCAARYKEPACIAVEESQVVLEAGKLEITMETDGYVEGRIFSEKGQLQPSLQRFTSADFQDGRLTLTITKNQSMVKGSDILCVQTVRQDFSIPVEWWGSPYSSQNQKEKSQKVKKQRAELMHNYLYFRTGSIGFEDFAKDSNQVLDDLYYLTKDLEWRLYKTHFLLMEERKEEAREALEELSKMDRKEKISPLYHNYFLYLEAMLYRSSETIASAVMSIREFYETSEYKAEALWMLIYLDREYVYNKRLQYDTIAQLFAQGYNSCLLYFEVCEILNENPNYMEGLGVFEINVFRWGVRYGYVSLSLAYQFAQLALKVKYYSNAIFSIAQKLYLVEPDEKFLQVICSLFIKGNRTAKECHEYFSLAVRGNLKIIGLNEFFVRSMDFEKYELIPQQVLIYFTYSNSLDYLEKAYLYSNVLRNQKAYDEIFGVYHSKMLPFVEEQLLKGRMNEHLAYLYTYFQKEILEKPENAKAVCDILFYQKLTCRHPSMIGVYVAYPEIGKETYYPLSNGFSYVEIFNQRTRLYFVDSNEQRYVMGIPYQLQPFLSLTQFPGEWVQKNLENKKVLLRLSGKVGKTTTEAELPILHRLAFADNYKSWICEGALENLLVYYENHQDKKQLARWLERTDYSHISKNFRKRLMNFYMEVGMIENAYFGVELYGSCIMGTAKRLKLASFGVRYYEGEKEETTLHLAYSAFLCKKYNRDTLTYLMRFFEGETEDLLSIWEKGKRFELPTADFEKKILEQCMFTGNDTEGVFPVFESYYKEEKEEPVIRKYLEYASMKELSGIMQLPDSMHRIIGNEILCGRIKEKKSKIHFLYYFSGKEDWYDRIKDAVVCIIEEFLEEKYYLPIYHIYKRWISFPVHYEELTFLTYRGGRGRSVVFFYQIEGEELVQEKYLEEVLPGLYVCSMHFFHSDHVNYRLEEEGEPIKEESALKFETFEYKGEDSRFFLLNHLDTEESSLEELQNYLMKSFFTDQFVSY